MNNISGPELKFYKRLKCEAPALAPAALKALVLGARMEGGDLVLRTDGAVARFGFVTTSSPHPRAKPPAPA